jgi:heptosyltransferase-2
LINTDIKIDSQGKGNIRIDKSVLQKQGRRIISLMPFAKWKTKEWGDDKFIGLGKRIGEEVDADILVLGGREDAARAEAVAHLIGGRAKSAAGKFAILETAAALSISDILVTNDTGVMHMAGAVSIPVVSIFGCTTEELGFFPYNTKGTVIQKSIKCRPCTAKGLNKCPKKHFTCMKDISVEEVYNTVRRYI